MGQCDISLLLHSPLYVQASPEIYWHYLAKGLRIEQNVGVFDNIHACNAIGRRDRSRNKYNSLDGQLLTVANHKGFIPADLWLKVQDKLAGNPQISRANAGKYTWLTGLLKCGKCGYSTKINFSKTENRARLICSGRSNLSVCDASIHVDLRELERCVAERIKTVLNNCPPEEVCPDTSEGALDILEIEQKTDRLIAALAESSEISFAYINRQIEKLHKEKEAMLARAAPKTPHIRQLDFDALDFQEKKVVAAEFIEKILLIGDEVNIIWK